MVLPKKKIESATYHGHSLQHEVTHGRPGGLNRDELPHVIVRSS